MLQIKNTEVHLQFVVLVALTINNVLNQTDQDLRVYVDDF